MRLATTAAITLADTQMIDGVPGVVGDRILVKDQASPATNGIYLMAAGAWGRAPDMNSSEELAAYDIVVQEGGTHEGTLWRLISTAPLVLNTSDLVFAKVSLDCQALGGPVCTDQVTGEIPGEAVPYPALFTIIPPLCAMRQEWRIDTNQSTKYRLAICPEEGANPLMEPYVAKLDQVCVDGTDCETCPEGQDCTLNLITGTNLTATATRTGNALEVTLNSSAGLSFAGETRGDLARRGASVWERVPLGSNGTVLKSNGTDPVWSADTDTRSHVYSLSCNDDADAGATSYFLRNDGIDCNLSSLISTNRKTIVRSGTLRNLYCTASAAPGGGNSAVLTAQVNGSLNGITCTLGSAATGCNDTTNTAAVSAGDTLGISYDPTADITLQIACSLEVES